jgi:putative transcriptional regulator
MHSPLDSERVVVQASRVTRIESNVRERRLELGLSQEGLARKVGVSRQTIVNIEKGLSEPKVLLAIAIAGALGVVILSDLFGRSGEL